VEAGGSDLRKGEETRGSFTKNYIRCVKAIAGRAKNLPKFENGKKGKIKKEMGTNLMPGRSKSPAIDFRK